MVVVFKVGGVVVVAAVQLVSCDAESAKLSSEDSDGVRPGSICVVGRPSSTERRFFVRRF